MASLTLCPASSMTRRASPRVTPVASMTTRSPRSTSFSLNAIMSTIKFPKVLPSRIIVPVEMVLRTNFVAVPAFNRVEPVRASGPACTAITKSHRSARSSGGWAQVSSPVAAPTSWARLRAAHTYGVVPLAAMPNTKSFGPTEWSSMAAVPAATSSSAPSWDRVNAAGPPAITPTTISGGVPNVGGHSVASKTPSRPLVPAPTYSNRPPPPIARVARSIASAM